MFIDRHVHEARTPAGCNVCGINVTANAVNIAPAGGHYGPIVFYKHSTTPWLCRGVV